MYVAEIFLKEEHTVKLLAASLYKLGLYFKRLDLNSIIRFKS